MRVADKLRYAVVLACEVAAVHVAGSTFRRCGARMRSDTGDEEVACR